jgi:hypothetical protein
MPLLKVSCFNITPVSRSFAHSFSKIDNTPAIIKNFPSSGSGPAGAGLKKDIF